MPALAEVLERSVHAVPGLGEAGLKVARSIHKAVLGGGKVARSAADALHGTWLGHSLHPVLTYLPLGAWTVAALYDVAALLGAEDAGEVGDQLIVLGALGAVPTAMAGMADYSAIPEDAAATGTMHAILNSSALALYLAALPLRKGERRGLGTLLSLLAYTIVGTSATLGTDMTYRYGVGVNHSPTPKQPNDWTDVLDAVALGQGTPRRVEVEGQTVLLYRDGEQIYAIGAVCSHAGGPLEKGRFEGHCVECPWHQSVFDLRNGEVVHGPATHEQPAYEARIADGQVQVRLRHAAHLLSD